MTAAKKVPPAAPDKGAGFPLQGSILESMFEIRLHHRHDEHAPIEVIRMAARTIASARHLARIEHPDGVILSVKKL